MMVEVLSEYEVFVWVHVWWIWDDFYVLFDELF